MQPPRIYSYVRFSSERQLKGDSLRRQNELIDRYTKQKGYKLDSEFRYVDVGVPAFRGQNLKEGKLRLFIEAIREGKVPVGSVLLIESLDRLTRMQPREALSVFLEIVNAGVKIVTLADGEEHSPDDSADKQMVSLLISATKVCLSHEESLKKSRRGKSAWKNKREHIKTKYYTKRIPRWLELSEDRLVAREIKSKSDIVKRMFKLCLDGESAEDIAQKFRDEKIPLVAGGKYWTHSYVAQTLRNKAVIGVFTPHRMENGKRVPASEPIKDYYPRIIDETDFARVQYIMDSRSKNKGGRRGKKGDNLFRKKLFCGYCGASVYVNYKGRYYKGKARKTLVCRNAQDGTGCFLITWDYWEFEDAFISAASELHILLKNKTQGKALREAAQGLEGKLAEISKTLKNYQEMLERDDGIKPKTILNRMKELEEEQEELSKKREEVEKRISAGMEGPKPLVDLKKLTEKVKDPEVRVYLADLISQLFQRIDLFPAGRKLEFERLKKMHDKQVQKWGKNDGHVKAYIRDNFDRRKHRFFQPVLNLPGVNKRLSFKSDGSKMIEARLDLVDDLPEDALMVYV